MNPVLISNTGPIIAFSGVDHLDQLSHLYVRTLVPASVDREVKGCIHNKLGLENYLRANWIEVVEPVEVEPLLRTELDAGEAAVISLALKESHAKVLIDERKGRKIARLVYGLDVRGSVRVLNEAKKAGLIPNIQDLIQQMRANGYRIHDSIVEYSLWVAGEK